MTCSHWGQGEFSQYFLDLVSHGLHSLPHPSSPAWSADLDGNSQPLCSWASLDEKVASMLHASLGTAPQRQGWGDWVVSRTDATILTCHHFDTLVLLANTDCMAASSNSWGWAKGREEKVSLNHLLNEKGYKTCCSESLTEREHVLQVQMLHPQTQDNQCFWDQSSFLDYVCHPGNAAMFLPGISWTGTHHSWGARLSLVASQLLSVYLGGNKDTSFWTDCAKQWYLTSNVCLNPWKKSNKQGSQRSLVQHVQAEE